MRVAARKSRISAAASSRCDSRRKCPPGRFLHDRSNANTARWCSMALCGNRFKARRHYQRTRSAD
ncbi:CGNR zinc finger domain-containing protein [Promicromonospora sp. NFX87]|uniref:CGNR zinc finger domain-containing protein n=1 Tax=Promicromonospora sp. NFX87 TaxID=3402691 RepID=UPI003AFAADD3